MACIVKSYDKKTGTTYIYRSESFWDTEKKRPSSRRKCIGKLDPITGQVVPTGKRGRPRKVNTTANAPPINNVNVPSEDSAKLQDRLLGALARIENYETQNKKLEAKCNALEAENKLLKQKLNSISAAFYPMSEAFTSFRTMLEKLK